MRKISIKPQERKLSFASIFLGKQENQLLELEHSASWLESGSFRKKMYGLSALFQFLQGEHLSTACIIKSQFLLNERKKLGWLDR